MVKAIDPNQEFSAVHPDDADLPASEQTVWKYTVLGPKEQEALDNNKSILVESAAGESYMAMHGGTVELSAVKFALRPPENFSTEWKDEPAGPRFSPGKMHPTDAFLATIPRHVRAWLAVQIRTAGMLTEEDAGKSSQQSTAPSTKDSSPTAGSVQGQAVGT